MKAHEILSQGAAEMEDRARTYDSPEGERSMAKAVEAFNAMHGTDLTTVDGWRFMAILKLVRSTQGDPRLDNWVDLAAYAALAGEDDCWSPPVINRPNDEIRCHVCKQTVPRAKTLLCDQGRVCTDCYDLWELNDEGGQAQQ